MAKDLSRFEWWYEIGGERRGPISASDLLALAAGGDIDARTMVSFDGGATWQSYREVAADLERGPVPIDPGSEIEAAASPTVTGTDSAACAFCGRVSPKSELLAFGHDFVCAECKPVFLHRIRAGESVTRGMDYGGFWIRAGAKFIDGLILYAVNFVLNMVMAGLLTATTGPDSEPGPALIAIWCGFALFQLGIAVAYTVYFLGRYGATPGKMALRLRVIRSDGSSLTYGRAFGRYFGDLLSNLTLMIGYIIAAFDDQKRALHDHLCDTRVVRVG